jgi:hypothetical protein
VAADVEDSEVEEGDNVVLKEVVDLPVLEVTVVEVATVVPVVVVLVPASKTLT